jgi:hypothetical protein
MKFFKGNQVNNSFNSSSLKYKLAIASLRLALRELNVRGKLDPMWVDFWLDVGQSRRSGIRSINELYAHTSAERLCDLVFEQVARL